MPENPRAASLAASGFDATATFPSSPRFVAQRKRLRAISGSVPKRDSMPAKSRIAVSAAASSTQGEKDCAQSSNAACVADSCSGERGRSVNSEQSSAWALVIPGEIPARLAFSFMAKTFSSGGLPSKIATACARNSGSARNIAATGKFGTKMQANMKQYPVPGCQYPEKQVSKF